jgi:hypothetical protein
VRTRPLLCFVLLLLLVVANPGCEPRGRDAALGELGNVELSYRRSCFFGCTLAQPLLLGTREEIALSARGDDETRSVKSDAEDVAEFALDRTCYCERDSPDDRIEIDEDASCKAPRKKRCEALVGVLARGEGEATLTLLDEAGRTLERGTVYVREAKSARFRVEYPMELGGVVERIELEPGQKAEVELRLYDADGVWLLAPEGVLWHSDSADVAQVTAFLIGGGKDVLAGSNVTVEAKAQGNAELGIDVPGLATTIPIHVR